MATKKQQTATTGRTRSKKQSDLEAQAAANAEQARRQRKTDLGRAMQPERKLYTRPAQPDETPATTTTVLDQIDALRETLSKAMTATKKRPGSAVALDKALVQHRNALSDHPIGKEPV